MPPRSLQDRAPAIATDLSIIGDWWRRQDLTREPRFDFTAVPGDPGHPCDSRADVPSF